MICEERGRRRQQTPNKYSIFILLEIIDDLVTGGNYLNILILNLDVVCGLIRLINHICMS